MLFRALALATVVSSPVLAAAMPIGVPECDDMMQAYDRCVGSNLTGADRTTAGDAVRRIGDGWRIAAQDPTQRAGLGAQCTRMSQMMGQSMTTSSCRF